jgi:hypothetical protein
MLIVTAFNRSAMECGIMCVRSIERYLARHPQYHLAVEAIPEDYERHPSWFKVEVLLKHIDDHDFVLWMDADSLLIGRQDIRNLLADTTVNLAKDKNGLNAGIMAWKNCSESMYALERMRREYEQWKDGPWFEQHVLMEMEGHIGMHFQDKRIWNAYYGEDVCDQTLIVHWPGMSMRDRLPQMQREFLRTAA